VTGVELASTQDGREWLFRPVEHGFCKYESLIDGTLSLADVFEMNQAIDLMIENRNRLSQPGGA
jgi:hypothetical protein